MPSARQQQELDLAAAYGATFIEDPRRGAGWGKFDLLGWHVWHAGRAWIRAKLVDGRWSNHVHHSDLEGAFKAIAAAHGRGTTPP